MTNDGSSERVLVLAPVGGDGPALATLLRERGVAAEVCRCLTEVCAEMAEGAGALLLTEEALELRQTPDLFDQLKAQPPWSEMPLIVLTRGSELHLARLLDLAADAAGAITLLERPISKVTLLRSVEVALRSRRRQYEVRDLIEEKARNIAELKRAEEALRASEERLRFALDSSRAGNWELDLLTFEAHISLEHNRIFGYQQLLPQWNCETFLDHVVPEDRTTVDAKFRSAVGNHSDLRFECRIQRADGKVRWIAVTGRHSGDGKRMAGITQDITDRKLAEESLRETEERLHRTEKIAATGRLAAALAHEINNPLTAVINALYLLEENRDLTPEAKNLARTAASEVDRVARIVKQSLSYHRVGTVPEKLDLSAIAEESLQVFNDKFRRADIQVTKRLTPDAQIMGFAAEIRQVIDNLLLNALEASSSGGRLVVSVRLSRDWRADKRGVRLTIGDTGSGIAKENLSRIFEPFVTTKYEKGTGLGLWVVLGIVTKHEGSIRIRSVAGNGNTGTVVSILWPSQNRINSGPSVGMQPAA